MPEKNDDLPSLAALQQQIDRLKPPPEDNGPTRRDSDYAQAFRFTVELSSGVLVGGMVGYGIDIWLGSLPWATILCIFLGMGAGIRNMMRSARDLEKQQVEDKK